jgi:5-methylcytosine-specific restriction endonuclease McrA
VDDLSLDHVVPRSRGGKLTWTNTVTACLSCNYRKGYTLPEDLHKIGMRLKNSPRVPSSAELQFKAKTFKKSSLHPHWTVYIDPNGDAAVEVEVQEDL